MYNQDEEGQNPKDIPKTRNTEREEGPVPEGRAGKGRGGKGSSLIRQFSPKGGTLITVRSRLRPIPQNLCEWTERFFSPCTFVPCTPYGRCVEPGSRPPKWRRCPTNTRAIRKSQIGRGTWYDSWSLRRSVSVCSGGVPGVNPRGPVSVCSGECRRQSPRSCARLLRGVPASSPRGPVWKGEE